jgi:hypothetical protein
MNDFFQLPTQILALLIFCLIILFNWSGYRFRKAAIKRDPNRIHENMGSIEGSILGVMSLLLGFTFSQAVSKFEMRRQLIVEEANSIHSAMLNCDMYPDSIRSPLIVDFKEYINKRIAYYDAGNKKNIRNKEMATAHQISDSIWNRVMLHAKNIDLRLSSQLMIPEVKNMSKLLIARDAAGDSRVPPLILWTLLILVLTSAFLLGTDYKGHKRSKALLYGYALVMTLTLNLITELNHSQDGFINLNVAEKRMEDLKILHP